MNRVISGSLYGRDLSQTLVEAFANDMVTCQLKFLKRVGEVYRFVSPNCHVEVLVADHNKIKWLFYRPDNEPVFHFTPHLFTQFVLNSKIGQPVNDFRGDSFEELIDYMVLQVRNQMKTILPRPISGDYSWAAEYIRRLKQLKKYNAFFFATKSSDSDYRKNVGRMFRVREAGWEEAIGNYFAENYPDGGAEFETDPIFSLFPEV